MSQGRSVYKVYVVDPRGAGKVIMDGKVVIAVSEDQALIKAGVAEVLAEKKLELEQVDTYAQHIGTFVRPRRETQKVAVVKDEDDE